MRKEQELDNAALVIVLVALGLTIAVVVAMAERHARTGGFDPFVSAEPGASTGFTSPLLQGNSQVRVNELPQVN